MSGSQDTINLKIRAARQAFYASLGLATLKLVCGFLAGSLSLITEAIHSAMDSLAALMSFFAVRMAAKPADDNHHYGHEKIEAIAALITTGLLITVVVGVCLEALARLWNGVEAAKPSIFILAVMVIILFVDASRWHMLRQAALTTKSRALEADALHFAADFVGTGLVILSLIAAYFGYGRLDSVFASAIALFIGHAAYRLGARAITHLLDAAPEGASPAIRAQLKTIGGVVDVTTIKLREAGATLMGETTLTVSRLQPAQSFANIKAEAERRVERLYPGAAIAISLDPIALDNETLREKVLLIAAQKHLPVHHIFVQNIEGKTSVSLDLELDGNLPLNVAHDIASEFEKAICEDLGAGLEVETHIEPLDRQEFTGTQVDGAKAREIALALEQAAAQAQVTLSIHDVRVRAVGNALAVHYHGYAPAALTVWHIHNEFDRIDRSIKSRFPDIRRIVGHAEPDTLAPK